MRALLRAIDGVCAAGAAVAAAAAFLLAAMLIVEVVATSFFAWSQPWAVEYSGYLLAAILFAGSGWTLRQGAHIRVSALIGVLPPHVFRRVDVAATVFALGVAGFMAWASVDNAVRSFEIGSVSYYPSRTPLFLPQAVLAFGIVVLGLALLARLLRLLAGEPPEVAPSSPVRDGDGLR